MDQKYSVLLEITKESLSTKIETRSAWTGYNRSNLKRCDENLL